MQRVTGGLLLSSPSWFYPDGLISYAFTSASSFIPSSSQPQPQPQLYIKPKESISSNALVDISPVYLYDRSNWADFKKILNECGGVWNLPHWMTTILRGGDEWKHLQTEGNDMNSIFPTANKISAGDGVESKNSSLSGRLIAGLGLPKNLGDAVRTDVQYCCLSTIEFEDDRRLPARQKMWQWMCKSLKGIRSTVGSITT